MNSYNIKVLGFWSRSIVMDYVVLNVKFEGGSFNAVLRNRATLFKKSWSSKPRSFQKVQNCQIRHHLPSYILAADTLLEHVYSECSQGSADISTRFYVPLGHVPLDPSPLPRHNQLLLSKLRLNGGVPTNSRTILEYQAVDLLT